MLISRKFLTARTNALLHAIGSRYRVPKPFVFWNEAEPESEKETSSMPVSTFPIHEILQFAVALSGATWVTTLSMLLYPLSFAKYLIPDRRITRYLSSSVVLSIFDRSSV